VVDIEGLADEFIDAEALCHRIGMRGTADRDDSRSAALGPISVEELRSVRRGDLIAVLTERELEDPDCRLVVLHDEDPF
jgi:hypothetical protein